MFSVFPHRGVVGYPSQVQMGEEGVPTSAKVGTPLPGQVRMGEGGTPRYLLPSQVRTGGAGGGTQWRIQDFPDGGAPTPEGGAPTYYLTNFSQKLHENEENLTQRGGRASLRPPPRSANGTPRYFLHRLV